MDGGGGSSKVNGRLGGEMGKEQEAQTAFKNERFSVPLLCSQVIAVHM